MRIQGVVLALMRHLCCPNVISGGCVRMSDLTLGNNGHLDRFRISLHFILFISRHTDGRLPRFKLHTLEFI
jgi:hypothetical protein